MNDPGRRRTLSSQLTILHKFVLPAIPILTIGVVIALMWLKPGWRLDGGASAPVEVGFRILFGVAWVIGTVALWKYAASLKKVILDGDRLLVSNYREEIVVPLHSIQSVHQSFFWKTRPVVLQLTHETPFGDTIVFVPEERFRFRLFKEDPVVLEIRQLAKIREA